MLLVLKRSPEQQAKLDSLLAQQQDTASPQYHKWLTPEQFGQHFGLDGADAQAVTSWLQSQGFNVARVARGRGFVEFSGSAGQVQAAFHTTIHRYEVRGRSYWANATDPAIPAALAPAVGGVVSLHDFPRHPQHVVRGVFARAADSARALPLQPAVTQSCQGYTCYALGPYDFATIYNVLPLWSAGIDGSGWTLAIVGESDVNPQDLSQFRALFGMPAPQVNVIHNGVAPGILPPNQGLGDESESDLDLEWAGAIAKGATIDFVTSASTNTTQGVDLSAEYIVDNDLAPVLSESYGACELAMGTSGNLFYKQLWEQAAAEGISVFVAAGDSGSAGCDIGDSSARDGLAVSGIASSPQAVAVGGTDFNDLSDGSLYWNATNDPVTQASAKGYIPETPWNDSCTNPEISILTKTTDAETNCNNVQVEQFGLVVVGGGGGASNCTTSDGQNLSSCGGGYAKPAWQPGSDGHRDLPDVSLFAGDGFNGNFYLVCEEDISGSPCTINSGFVNVLGVGGTSAAAPTWAALQLLVDQKTGMAQGDPHFVYYHLAAQQTGSGCISSSGLGSSCVFADVATGTNAMPCFSGTYDCTTLQSGHTYGVLTGYSAIAGFDPATGLGSVNAANLVNSWSGVAFAPSSATLTLNPTTGLTHGAAVNVQIGVQAKSGTSTPSGLVSLLTSSGQEVADFTLSSGAVTATTSALPGGTYTVHAHYAGDGTFAPSDSAPVSVTVAPEASSTTASAFWSDSSGRLFPISNLSYGEYLIFRADVAGASKQGQPTGNISFLDNGAAFDGGPYPLNSESSILTPTGIATLPPGAHSIVAQYSGDSSFQAGASPALTFTIAPGPTSTLISGSSMLLVNTSTPSWTVDIGTQSYGAAPTGTITFSDNGNAWGSPIPVTGSGPPGQFQQLFLPVSLSTSPLPLGNSTVVAKYSGDGNYAAATSPPVFVDVQIPTTLTLAASTTTPTQGDSFTVTATVASSQAGPAPIGGQIYFGGQATPPAATVVNGQAQVTVGTYYLIGQQYVAANYGGDQYYAASSAQLQIQVQPVVKVIPANTQLSVNAPGGKATDAFQVTFASNYKNTVAFACPAMTAETFCKFDPGSMSASGTTTLTVTTTAPSELPPPNGPTDGPLGWVGLAAFAALFALLRKRPARRWRVAAAGLLLAFCFAACGGGYGSARGNGGNIYTNPGTPAGQYPFTVTVTNAQGQLITTVQMSLDVP